MIDEMSENNGKTTLKKLGFPDGIEIDIKKLIIGGHSFGGMTAIHTALNDDRVSLVATLDPWLYAFHD